LGSKKPLGIILWRRYRRRGLGKVGGVGGVRGVGGLEGLVVERKFQQRLQRYSGIYFAGIAGFAGIVYSRYV
jgi:hypothetical protein